MMDMQAVPTLPQQGQSPQVPQAQPQPEPATEEVSFENLWRQEIERLTQFEEQQRWAQMYAQSAYPQPSAPRASKGDEGENGEGEEEAQVEPPSEFVKMAVKVAIQEGLSPLLKEHPELEDLGIVNLTKQYLSSFPPHAITPDLTKATALMFYGLYALKNKEYQAKKQAEQAKAQKPSLPADEAERVRRYAEIWGLDADYLYQKVLEERAKEVQAR
jgi:hypothetical protein